MTLKTEELRYFARLAACYLLLGLLPAFAEVQIIPQVADGGGWSTTIVLSNKTTASQSVNLRFNRDTTNGATEAWTPAFLESVSLPTFNLAAGSTMFLHTPGTAAAVTQGWGELDAGPGVVGYAIFTLTTNSAQDGTAPAVTAATRILVPFDNSSGLVTAVAMANPNASAESIQVNIKTSDGATSTGVLPQMPASGHMAFVLPDLFPETSGKRGLAEFYTTSGSFSTIALRFNPRQAFASAPVYPQTGQPIIGTTVTNPPASTPQVQIIPQVADGGIWSTTIVLTNTTTSNLTASLNFRLSVAGSGGATSAWNPAFLENLSTSNLSIPAGSTIFLQTPGTASSVSQGYAELTASPGINGYAIFTARTESSTQDATAPAVSASGRLLVPFDNDTGSGLVTSVAIVNPNATSQSITLNLRTSDGTTTTNLGLNLPAQGHLAVVLPNQFAATAGTRGLAEFYTSSGTIAFIALRARPGGAFTSAPAYFETGVPIITSGGGGGNGGGGSGSGGGDTTPTPSEIESWIAKGTYSAGSLGLTRATAYATTDTVGAAGVTPVTAMTKLDTFSGQFTRVGGADLAKSLRNELPPGFPTLNPTPGSCVVYNVATLTNPYPNLTSVGLDAGPQVTSNGPNGNQSALRQSIQVSGFTYNAANVPNTYLAPGRYTLTGPGGADVGGFSGALDIVQDLVVTNNPDDFKVLDRNGGITVRWTGGEPSTVLTISGSSYTINQQTSSAEGSAFVCIENTSAGQFTVPASILSQLPASGVIGAGGFNFITRGTFSVTASGKGSRFSTPSGLDILTVFNFWSWSFTPQYK
ncbi:hypothetical protein [Paludibaculum fermentans]|uniref:hypothetical protein n=1 Tax=Paludibaculum fermentans TaxID=1473598 RepID=UPI003EB78D1B